MTHLEKDGASSQVDAGAWFYRTKWNIHKFLCKRTQQGDIDGISSDKVFIDSGVPQGTTRSNPIYLY